MPTRTVIINGDDIGFTPGITRGIVEAFQQGVLTSTTAMVNLPGAPERVAGAHAAAPGLPIGLHLNITAGQPVLPPERVPSLVDGQGRFYPLLELGLRLDAVSLEEVRAELQAQAALLREVLAFDHIDYHQMLLSLYAPFYPLVIELAQQYRVPVRMPAINRFAPVKLPGKGGASAAAVKGMLGMIRRRPLYMLRMMPNFSPQAANRQYPRLKQAGIPTTDWFITAFFDNPSIENFIAVLEQLPEGTSEVMVHPGYVDDDLLASGDDYTIQREKELSVLLDPRVREKVEMLGIRLASFSDLKA